ncbi:MAG: alpha-amylase [Chlorobiales bacterium]|nr:alpha-amylase [Chlorobiales bacterium]
MGVIMQAFHWDCPRADNQEYLWWNFVQEKVPTLAQVGFTSLWLPPAHKAANISGPSMGYDPYDYYDLGEFDQKGSVKTWFGSKQDLLDLITIAHTCGMTVLADMVLNHNSGADAKEQNLIDGTTRWTFFDPRSGSFQRDWRCFNPSPFETWDGGVFGDMPDLCHRNPYVYGEILKLARWLIEEIGFDGFRYDFVKGYGAWVVTAIQEYRYEREGKPVKPYGVGENWSSDRTIENWLNETNAWSDNPVGAFDFPLRDVLKNLCDSNGYSLRNLADAETVVSTDPFRAVTFVENHDLRDNGNPIINDKLLAYGYILTHEGHPCVFWKDYYNYKLGKEGTPNGIAALVKVHETYAGGGTVILWEGDDLYIMERSGYHEKNGLIFVLNNRGDQWNGASVVTQWRNTGFKSVAWWSSKDLACPSDKWTDAEGRADFWAPPRGYAVYVPNV